jgi:hypothetical protein
MVKEGNVMNRKVTKGSALLVLAVFAVSCTMPSQNSAKVPTRVPSTALPTAVPTPTKVPTEIPEPTPVYQDVPGASTDTQYLEEYARLLEEAAVWSEEEGVVPPCQNGDSPSFCPDELLSLVVFHTSMTSVSVFQQRVGEVIEEQFPEAGFLSTVERGPYAQVVLETSYPDYECEYKGYFTDMGERDKYTCAAEALVDHGLYLLKDLPTSFDPEDTVTRGQHIVWLYLMSGEGRLQ